MSNYYIQFTKEMKKTHTILIPNMLPIHFRFLQKVFNEAGFKTELLKTDGPEIRETGLKYVHNDACYPAILVIGQFISAIESGKYDPKKTALVYFQTGGGCRASNYISMLRKALTKAGYGYVPVISFSLAGIEEHPGFKLSLRTYQRAIYAVLYGDMFLQLKNQVDPYEIEKGAAERLTDKLSDEILRGMSGNGMSIKALKANMKRIVEEFKKIPCEKKDCIQVGVVGEIYVKFSPLGNNNLVKFLVNEGAEVNYAGLLDFVIYCIYNFMRDAEAAGLKNRIKYKLLKQVYKLVCNAKKMIIDIIKEDGYFKAPTPFEEVVEGIKPFMDTRCKMGEGWLLPAEMLELYHSGVKNIVCTQPFGCLPNHIVGKGMMKPFKDTYSDMNIVAVDYDPGSTQVNLENRLKLMLANSKL